MPKKIQKHISIPEDFAEEIKAKMRENGQKLSPLCNSLLVKYFKGDKGSKLAVREADKILKENQEVADSP